MNVSEISDCERKLLSGAERRMTLGMWILGGAAIGLCWLWQGWRWGVGFALGAILSAVNFHWLKSAATAVADLAAAQGEKDPETGVREQETGNRASPELVDGEQAGEPGQPWETGGTPRPAVTDRSRSPKPVRMAIRLALRYVLIGVAAYVIFKSSLISLRAFFLGLFLFIAAVLAEIMYEVYYSFRNS